MKKAIILILAGWGFAGGLLAGTVGMGVKGGVDFASQTSPNPIVENLIGITGGLYVDIPLNDVLSLQPEADFVMKGNQITAHGVPITDSYGNIIGITNVNQTERFNYLEFPLLLKAKVGEISDWKVYVYGGPEIATLLNETTSITNTAWPNPAPSDNTRYYPGTDWGLVLGIMAEVHRFVMETRYDLGLSSASMNAVADRSSGENRVLSVQVGYQLY